MEKRKITRFLLRKNKNKNIFRKFSEYEFLILNCEKICAKCWKNVLENSAVF